MIPLTVIKAPPRGNAKLGPVLTESRPTGPTCPSTCFFLQSGQCYSIKGERYHPGAIPGWAARDGARRSNRAAWRAARARTWRKEAEAGRAVRFLVHGDLMDPEDKTRIDRGWAVDVLLAARAAGPRFRAWGYTHAWRFVRPSTLRAFRRVGIQLWASCHTKGEARAARRKGFPVAFISKETVKGYEGPAALKAGPGGRPAVVCPEQLGSRPDCASCGFCFRQETKADLILLSH
jgi:hypothetical protein